MKLCPSCARAYGVGGAASAVELDLGLLLSSPGAAPEGRGRRPSPALCPSCGTPAPRAGRSGLGCPDCATAFRSELRRILGLAGPGLFLKTEPEPERPSPTIGADEGGYSGALLETWIDCRRESAAGRFAAPESHEALRDLPLPPGFVAVDPSLLGELRSRSLVERGFLSSSKAAEPSAALALPREGEGWLLAIEDGAGLRLRGRGSASARGGSDPRALLEKLFGLIGQYSEEAFAFDPEFGYLARSAQGLGWGIELGIGLCLPALAATAGLEAPFRALLAAGFEIRGLTPSFEAGADPGEETGLAEGVGTLFELVVRPCLEAPRQAVARLEAAAARLARAESEAAARLRRRDSLALEDRLGRALGILSSCRRVGEAEALARLATLRLAVAAGLLPPEAAPPAEVFSGLGPASLALALGLPGLPRGLAADEARAAFLGAKARNIIETRAWGGPEAPRGR